MVPQAPELEPPLLPLLPPEPLPPPEPGAAAARTGFAAVGAAADHQ